MKKSLHSSEWVLVASLLLIMASLVTIAKINATRAATTLSAYDLQPEEICITIEGAVCKPGEYKVLSGTPLHEAVRKARPKPFANLKKIPLTEIIEAPTHIEIGELSEIHISVGGAVSTPANLIVPVGTRICDLKSKVSLTAEADKAFFRRRKRLKEGEFIEVPKKTVEYNSSN